MVVSYLSVGSRVCGWASVSTLNGTWSVTDGVKVRIRSVQLVEKAVSMNLLDKIVGAPWAPSGVMKVLDEVFPARLRLEDVVEVHSEH